MISLENVSFNYTTKDENDNVISTKTAVNNLCLTIDTGSFVCIIGKNGSGKSTLARLIKGLYTPSSGNINVDGFISMVFQNPDNQIVASIVEEDVAFGLENMGVETEEIKKRVDWALNIVGMNEFRFASPNKLSGGQKQKVAIAGAIAMKPDCLILDEPTAMLDPKGREDVLKTLVKLNKEEKITIILITHFMEETIFSDEIVLLDKGEMICKMTPRELFSNDKIINDYKLELPYVTKMAKAIKDDGYNINTNVLTVDELLECL